LFLIIAKNSRLYPINLLNVRKRQSSEARCSQCKVIGFKCSVGYDGLMV